MIAGDLGDHSESEDEEEGEAEKSRWEEIFFIFYHFTSGARKIVVIFSYLSYFRWKEVQDVEKRVKMEQEMIHQANPALLPDSHSDL